MVWISGICSLHSISKRTACVFSFYWCCLLLPAGYTKYVTIYVEMTRDNGYLEKISKEASGVKKEDTAGLGFGILANLRWFVREQRKIFSFDEGVFIFMLSLALILDKLTPMLWVFAISQLFYSLLRCWQRGCQIDRNQHVTIENSRF